MNINNKRPLEAHLMASIRAQQESGARIPPPDSDWIDRGRTLWDSKFELNFDSKIITFRSNFKNCCLFYVGWLEYFARALSSLSAAAEKLLAKNNRCRDALWTLFHWTDFEHFEWDDQTIAEKLNLYGWWLIWMVIWMIIWMIIVIFTLINAIVSKATCKICSGLLS